MREEFDALTKQHTWDLVPKPERVILFVVCGCFFISVVIQVNLSVTRLALLLIGCLNRPEWIVMKLSVLWLKVLLFELFTVLLCVINGQFIS